MNEIEPTATRWSDLRFEELKDAICEKWHGLQRRTLTDAWDLGRGLRALKDRMQHGEWYPYLDSISMSKSTAQRFVDIAEGYEISQLGRFASTDDAHKALPPKRKQEATEPEKPAETTTPTPSGPPTIDVVPEAEAEAAMQEAAAEAEAERDPVAERDARDERLANRLEGTSGDAVDVLNAKLDKAQELHREDVAAVNAARENAAFDRRKLAEVRDALLAIPRGEGDKGVDDVLARFFGLARK